MCLRVIPSSLRIQPPVRTREGYKIAERAGKAFLSARIREMYQKGRELSARIRSLQATLETVLLPEDYQRVTSLSYAAAEKTHASAKLKQTRKLEKLVNNCQKRPKLHPQGLDRWVVNLTGRSLTAPQKDVLSKGLNFAPAPTRLPVVDTIAAVEAGARQLKVEDAEDLRGRVCGILRRAKSPKDNLTKEQRKALKELKSLEDEVILLIIADNC